LNYSSGVDTDLDDLVVEPNAGEDDSSPVPSLNKTAENMTKDWDELFNKVPDDYTFKIMALENFEKGAQVYLTYGKLSNRESLRRYGFCQTLNKYNNLQFRLKIDNCVVSDRRDMIRLAFCKEIKRTLRTRPFRLYM